LYLCFKIINNKFFVSVIYVGWVMQGRLSKLHPTVVVFVAAVSIGLAGRPLDVGKGLNLSR